MVLGEGDGVGLVVRVCCLCCRVAVCLLLVLLVLLLVVVVLVVEDVELVRCCLLLLGEVGPVEGFVVPASARPRDTPEYRTLSSCSTLAKMELPNFGTSLLGLFTSIHTKP